MYITSSTQLPSQIPTERHHYYTSYQLSKQIVGYGAGTALILYSYNQVLFHISIPVVNHTHHIHAQSLIEPNQLQPHLKYNRKFNSKSVNAKEVKT